MRAMLTDSGLLPSEKDKLLRRETPLQRAVRLALEECRAEVARAAQREVARRVDVHEGCGAEHGEEELDAANTEGEGRREGEAGWSGRRGWSWVERVERVERVSAGQEASARWRGGEGLGEGRLRMP